MIDLTEDLVRALQAPAVISALASHLKPLLQQTLDQSAATALMDWDAAALHFNGRPGTTAAFRSLVHRRAELRALKIGSGRLSRFRRSDLDHWLKTHGGEHKS